MTQPNPSTAQARALADEMGRHRVAAALVSPGSRSSALAIAFEESSVPVHVVLDERSAAFQGIGIARASRRPVACISTSGTAVANFMPAVVEADLSGVPMILVTADRPPELRDIGSNQTVDQIRMFGTRVRWFCDMGLASLEHDDNGYWRSTISQALARAVGFGASPGPVHLNVSFREPTVPVPDDGRVSSPAYPYSIEGAAGGRPWQTQSISQPGPADLADLAGKRAVVIAGEDIGESDEIITETERLGWPLLTTALSGMRDSSSVTAYHHLLVDGVPPHLMPEAVVTAGRIGPSDRLGHLTGLAVPTVHIDRWGRWHDPRRHSTRMVEGEIGPTLALISKGAPSAYRESWLEADHAVREALAAAIHADESLTGPTIASALSSIDWGALVVASSMPIRDVDAFMTNPGRVIANRGASGIDGFNSTAIGVSRAIPGTLSVSGDLSFLHDLSGFLSSQGTGLVQIVVDNNGGGLFDLLPQAAHAPSYERLFVTPHGRDLTEIGRSVGLEAVRAGDIGEMTSIVDAKLGQEGGHLIVVPVDRSADLKQRRGLDDAARLAI